MYLLSIVALVNNTSVLYYNETYETMTEVFDKISDTLHDCEFMRKDNEIVEMKFFYEKIK